MFIRLLPVFVSIALGYILYSSKFLSDGMIDGFKKIVINICLPAILLSAFMNMKFKSDYYWVFLAIFIACVLMLIIGHGIAKIFKIKSPYFPFLITGFEAGMLGYGLFNSLYGADAIGKFAVVDVGQVLFVFLILVPMVVMLASEHKGSSGVKESLKIAVKSPVIWAILIGVLLAVFNIRKYRKQDLYIAVDTILNFVAAPTNFLICLVIGSGLKFSLKGMKNEFITVAVRLVITLMFAFIIRYVVFVPLKLKGDFVTALFILFLLPGPFVIPAFMKNPSIEDKNYVSNTLSINTLVSLVAIFIVVMVMK